MVDAGFLHGKYRGILLTATAQDANKHVYPLAFGVADSENDNAWKWFLQRLSLVIPDSTELVFASDRHQSISKAVEEVYVSAKHVICTRHLKQNIKARFKNRGVIHYVSKASECYTISEFESCFKTICDINGELGKYLKDADFEKWSRAHFKGDRYNLMTTNNAECINSVLKEARGYPVVALFDHIRNKLAEWFNDRRSASINITDLPPKVKEILQARYERSGRYEVQVLNDTQYQVNGGKFAGVVDLARKTCSCRVFDVDHMPCVHAIAAIQRMKLNITDFVSEYYKIQAWRIAYQETIYPVPSKEDWYVPDEIRCVECHPPVVRKKSGRPRKVRIPSILEGQRKKRNDTYKCGICKGIGHNKLTCPHKASSSTQAEM